MNKIIKAPVAFETTKGEQYEFNTARFIFEGNEITAEQAVEDDLLLAKLVEMKAGVITKVGQVPVQEGGAQ
jgi:hypothetical protein